MSNLKKADDYFSTQFMQPQYAMGCDIESELLDADMECSLGAYYCRLSADGFLDCTEWLGPFYNVEDCAEALMDTFAQDMEYM